MEFVIVELGGDQHDHYAAGGKDALIKQFLGLNIDLLISGKIAPELELALNEAGISVISGINDNCDAVIKAYMDGTLDF